LSLVKFHPLDGVVSQLKLLGVVVDHLSHGASKLVVLLLHRCKLNLQVRDLLIVFGVVGCSWSPRVRGTSLSAVSSWGSSSLSVREVQFLFLDLLAEVADSVDHAGTVSDLILQIKERLVIRLFKIGKDSISLVDISMVKANSHSLIIIVIFIAFEHLHFDQRQLVGGASAERA
jgi:hypothetical protein